MSLKHRELPSITFALSAIQPPGIHTGPIKSQTSGTRFRVNSLNPSPDKTSETFLEELLPNGVIVSPGSIERTCNGDLRPSSDTTTSRLPRGRTGSASPANVARRAGLSPREQEILSLVYQGQTNKAISRGTGISEKTVEKHRSRIMQKLQLTSHAALYRLVSRALLFSDRDPSGATDDAAIHAAKNGSIPTPHMFRFSDRIRQQ